MIKKIVAALVISILVIPTLSGQSAEKTTQEAEKQAILKTALDYFEGLHSADVERVAGAVDPELTKIIPIAVSQSGGIALRRAGSSQLREAVRARLTFVEEARRNISAEVLDFRQGLAAVLVKSAQFYEFLLLAKIEGVWKIVNVLWTNKVASSQRTASEIEAVREAVRKCALDYMDGYYSGDLDRVVRAIHPELTKVAPMAMPQTRRMMLGKQGASLVIEATRAKLSALDEAKRNIEIEVLGLHEGLALVRVLSAISYEYLQMANLGPDWQIINILWTTNPSAPKPAQK